MPDVSQAYIDHLKQGPFPQQVDPWVKTGRYFQQLHSEIISHLPLLFNDEQKQALEAAVTTWQTELEHLHP